MENKRKTETLKTKNGYEVVLKSFITGREMREIQSIYLNNAEVSMVGEEAQFKGITGALANEAEDKSFKLLIVSVNGKTEKVADEMGNLPLEDFDEVVKALNKITSVKKSESDTSKV